jgi:hypothetical protein
MSFREMERLPTVDGGWCGFGLLHQADAGETDSRTAARAMPQFHYPSLSGLDGANDGVG